MKNTIFVLVTLGILAVAIAASADTVIIPHRVIDARTQTVIDFEGLLARCSLADVVTLGENHDDPATHEIELAMLEGLFRTHGDVILSMEMFERDVQGFLDEYLGGELSEEEFLAGSHPWGNYETDYRPMVEFCRENGIGIVASNVPRHFAGRVSQGGYEMAEFSEEEEAWIASTFEAPLDGYYEAFAATMMMPGMEAMHVTEETVRLYYEAQVLKDETMAESVSMAHQAHPDSVALHVAGAFHLADYFGTFPRIERNLPDADCVSILVIPVEDLLAPVPEDTPRADYWILVIAPEDSEPVEMPEMPVMMPSEG